MPIRNAQELINKGLKLKAIVLFSLLSMSLNVKAQTTLTSEKTPELQSSKDSIIFEGTHRGLLPLTKKGLLNAIEESYRKLNSGQSFPTLKEEFDKVELNHPIEYYLTTTSNGNKVLILNNKDGSTTTVQINIFGSITKVVVEAGLNRTEKNFGGLEVEVKKLVKQQPQPADTITTKQISSTVTASSQQLLDLASATPSTYEQSSNSVINNTVQFDEPQAQPTTQVTTVPDIVKDTRPIQTRVDELLGEGMYKSFYNMFVREAIDVGANVKVDEIESIEIFKTPDGYGAIVLTEAYTSTHDGKRHSSVSTLFAKSDDGSLDVNSVNGESILTRKYGTVGTPSQSTSLANVSPSDDYTTFQPQAQPVPQPQIKKLTDNSEVDRPTEERNQQGLSKVAEIVEEPKSGNRMKGSLADFLPAGESTKILQSITKYLQKNHLNHVGDFLLSETIASGNTVIVALELIDGTNATTIKKLRIDISDGSAQEIGTVQNVEPQDYGTRTPTTNSILRFETERHATFDEDGYMDVIRGTQIFSSNGKNNETLTRRLAVLLDNYDKSKGVIPKNDGEFIIHRDSDNIYTITYPTEHSGQAVREFIYLDGTFTQVLRD